MGAVGSQEGNAIYHPHLEIRDVAWLKWTLLFWDSISRIRPPGYVFKDEDPEILEAVAEGALRHEDCASDVLVVTQDFEDNFDKYLAILGNGSAMLSLMNDRNLGAALANRLREYGFAEPEGDHLRMPRKLVAQTMVRLAQHISNRLKMPIVTDRPEYAELAEPFLAISTDGARTGPLQAAALQQLTAAFISQRSVGHLPMKTILEMRRDHREEIGGFRAAVRSASTRIAAISDFVEYRDAVADEERKIKDHLRALKMTSLLKRFEEFDGWVQVLAPITAGSIAYLAHVPEPILLAVPTVIGGAVQVMRKHGKRLSDSVSGDSSTYQFLMTIKRITS